MKRVGIIALQGAVDVHFPHLQALGVDIVEIRCREDLDLADGFILPGGESSTMLKLLDLFEMKKELINQCLRKPVWGICAGSILLAAKVTHPEQQSFGLLDMHVERNGYGSQVDSHEDQIDGYLVSFIRAPVIRSVGPDVQVLGTHRETPAWVRHGTVMATTFHPELTKVFPSPMHKAFVELLGD